MSVMVVLAGCGNMGFAMLSGWLKSGKLAPAEVFVVEPNAELRERAGKLGAQTAASAADLPADIAPMLVIFAVKPQVMREVVAGLSPLRRRQHDLSQHRCRHQSWPCSRSCSVRRRRSCAACPTRRRRSARA